jgi:hypothetical protein
MKFINLIIHKKKKLNLDIGSWVRDIIENWSSIPSLNEVLPLKPSRSQDILWNCFFKRKHVILVIQKKNLIKTFLLQDFDINLKETCHLSHF